MTRISLLRLAVYMCAITVLTSCAGTKVVHQWHTDAGPGSKASKLAVVATVWSIDVNLRRRRETVAMAFDVRTPSRRFHLRDEFIFRTYTAAQMRNLLGRVPELVLIETYNFTYDLDEPMAIDDQTEDVIFVLRKR